MNMGNFLQADTATETRGALKNLLAECAHALAEKHIIECPAHAAVVKFDIQQRLNQYLLLYDDWIPHITHHPLHVSHNWELTFGELVQTRKTLLGEDDDNKTETHRLLTKHLREKLNTLDHVVANELRRFETLEFISRELKQVRFYCPLTEDVYQRAKAQNKQRWEYVDLNPMHLGEYLNPKDKQRSRDRKELERLNRCVGEWTYGVFLEILYLNAYTDRYYSEFFLKHPAENTVYVIVACCKNVANAKEIKLLEKFVSNSVFKADPFSVVTLDRIDLYKKELTDWLEKAEQGAEGDKYKKISASISASKNPDFIHDLLFLKRDFFSKHPGRQYWPIKEANEAFESVSTKYEKLANQKK